MNAKPVLRRKAARFDIDAAADYYDREAGPDIALRFVDAVEDAIRAVGDRPGAGSSMWGNRLQISGLRSRKLTRFPFLLFYKEQEGHIEVWRVLHAQRDIPASLGARAASSTRRSRTARPGP